MTQNTITRLTESITNQSRPIATTLAGLVVVTLLVGTLTGGAVAAGGTTSGPAAIGASQPAAQNASNATSAPLIVSDSLVVSGETNGPSEGGCSVQNRYYRGQKVVFRVKVINPQTGAEMDNTSLNGVTVHVPSGNGSTKDLNAGWGKHGTDHFWAVAWTVPSGYPAGKVNYTISVTNHQSQKVNFAVPPSELTVVDKSLSQVKQAANSSSQSGNASSQGSPSAPSQGSLPWVFWLVVVVVAIVVIGLVYNGSRQE